MRNFEYYAPSSLQGASAMLTKFGPEAMVIAGGTDLMIKMCNKQLVPRYLIDLRRIPGLDLIEQNEDGVNIGSRTTMAALTRSAIIAEKYPALLEAASVLGSRQIRSVATIGGNICNAAPSAETATPLLVLGAQANIYNPEGGRSVPLEKFFLGPSKTCLQKDEILKSLTLAFPESGVYSTYIRHSTRKAMDIAVIGVAAMLKVTEKQVISQARVALGAVAPTPILVPAVEEVLVGDKLEDNAVNRVAEMAADYCRPISDVRASGEFRREMVRVYVKRALLKLKQQFTQV